MIQFDNFIRVGLQTEEATQLNSARVIMIIIRSIVLSICVCPRFCTRASVIKAPNVKKQFPVSGADGVSARINFHSDVSNAITDRAVLQELYRPARITRTTNPLITIACARYINQRMIFDAVNLSCANYSV